MDIVTNILFWLHFIGLGLGTAAAFGMPVVGRRIMMATPESRPALFPIADGLSMLGRAGLVVLIITGPLLVWLKFGGDMAAFGGWFAVKMVFVLLLLISIIVTGIQSKRAQKGDAAAAKRLPMLGVLNIVLLAVILLAAVFAFN
jgi:hypothetical protein